MIEEHQKTFDENNLRDFIDAFIAEQRKGEDSHFSVKLISTYFCYFSELYD